MPVLANLLRSLLGGQEKPAATTTDATQQQEVQLPPPPVAAPLPTPQPTRPELERREFPPVFSQRSLRQLGLFGAGAGFLAFSILVSRRAVRRHILKARLKYFQPNTYALIGAKDGAVETGRDPMVAFEALNLATLNVFSFAIMMAGGVSWSLDISSVDDLRRMARRSLAGVKGNTDEEAEKEVAEWFAKAMGVSEKGKEGEGEGEGEGEKKA
ncbi:hypothetical protein OQA88_7262 [Cercophora sp. LCS_1]